MTGKAYADILDIIHNETENKGLKWDDMQQEQAQTLLELAEGLHITTQLTMAAMRKYLPRNIDWNEFQEQFKLVDEREGCNNYLEKRTQRIMKKIEDCKNH